MTVVDVPQLGQSDDTTAEGDNKDNTSSGPDPNEVKQNLGGYFGGGSKGFNFKLRGPGQGGKPTED